MKAMEIRFYLTYHVLQKYNAWLFTSCTWLICECACDLPFPHRERDWEGHYSLGDTGDNLNQTYTRGTQSFVSTTQHSLVCNNDRQITSTMCVSEPLHAHVCVRALYTVKELVKGHSPP